MLTMDKGVRKRFRQTAAETLKLFSDEDKPEDDTDISGNLRDYLIESKIDALEIHSADKSCHYRWHPDRERSPFWIPTILTYDAHCIEEFSKADRVTHIKMTERSLQGLKDALSFPDTRIRFPYNLPEAPNPRLLGIQIKGNESSFFEDMTVAFAENLNCLIGVRGSGKSTMVEAMRYAFGYNGTLSEIGKSLSDSVIEMQQKNLSGSVVRVIYKTESGEERILESTYDPKENYSTKVYSASGDFIDVPDVGKSGDYPLRLYGWSEVETLGRTPSRQRDLLDRLVPEIAPVIEKKKNIQAELCANRTIIQQHVQQVKRAYDASDGGIRRYNEYKADFEKQNIPEVKELFTALDLANEKKSLLRHLKTNAESEVNKLNELFSLSVQSDLNEMLEEGSQELRDWWVGEESTHLKVSDVEQGIQKLLKQSVDDLRAFIELAESHLEKHEERIKELQDELKDKFTEDDSMQTIADLRANADKRLKGVTSLRQEYQKKWKVLVEAFAVRKEVTVRLKQVQNKIAEIREKKNHANEQIMNGFLPENMKVTIDFRAGRDTDEFSKILYTIFSNKNKQLKCIQKVISQHATPIEFATMMGKEDFSKLVGKTIEHGDETFSFSEEDAARCKEKTAPFEMDESADVKILAENGDKLNVILDVQETSWDDYETILLNGGPVNEKSPGQRSSAMLPLIALAERTPLIIDQPEDNLDKRLIGSVLMKVLSELKEQRQIIVCTHDPNILVGGDAEQVIVLEAMNDRKGEVLTHGSIDNDDIVKTVIGLLEGGAEAFESRQKRYRGRTGELV